MGFRASTRPGKELTASVHTHKVQATWSSRGAEELPNSAHCNLFKVCNTPTGERERLAAGIWTFINRARQHCGEQGRAMKGAGAGKVISPEDLT